MTITETILNRFGYVSQKQFSQKVTEVVKAELDKVPRWLSETADAQQWTIPDRTIFATQADMYRLSPILGTALDILGDDVGESKYNVKRMVGEETRDIPNHDFEVRQYGSMTYPNPLESGSEFLRDTVINYKLNGNAVWWLNRSSWDAIPLELWSIPFNEVEPIPDGRLYLKGYNYFPGNGKEKIFLPVWQVVYFKTYNPFNRFVGISPLESLALTLEADWGMRRTTKKTFIDYGGSPKDILAFKEWVPDDAWDDIIKAKTRAALENSTMMLRGTGDGVSWMSRAVSNKDADFIALIRQNMEDIFNRIAPGLLSMLSDGATYSNASAARATYSEKSLWKTLNMIAKKTTSEILPAYGRKLIGIFDDPRVVDRQIDLEEQKQYSLTHTVDMINKEYYEDAPIGDERGDLFITQINAQTGKPTPPPVQQLPTNQPNQPVNTQPNLTSNPAMPPDANNVPMKAELNRWKRYALRTFGKASFAKPFDSVTLPADIVRKVSAKLAACKTLGEVADVFENVKPTVKSDSIMYLASVINKAVNAE